MLFQPSESQKRFMQSLEKGDVKFITFDSMSEAFINYCKRDAEFSFKAYHPSYVPHIEMRLENGVWVKK